MIRSCNYKLTLLMDGSNIKNISFLSTNKYLPANSKCQANHEIKFLLLNRFEI